MKIEVLITPFAWLQLAPEVRNQIAKDFGLSRSTSPRCVTYGGVTTIESDGFTVDDLRGLNVESMQKWLGFSKIDPEADVHALLGMVSDRVCEALKPPETVVEPEKVVDSVQTIITEPKADKPFAAEITVPKAKPKLTKQKV